MIENDLKMSRVHLLGSVVISIFSVLSELFLLLPYFQHSS